MTAIRIESAYLHIASPDSHGDPTRTIEVRPALLVHLDADGRVLGVANSVGQVGSAELVEILRAVRVADQRANVTDKTEGKFRKRPVVVDARRWDGTASSATPIIDWILGNGQTARYRDTDIGIDTLEGTMSAAPGDWVIRGTAGEFYPCKPDIFADIYEPVTTEEPSRG